MVKRLATPRCSKIAGLSLWKVSTKSRLHEQETPDASYWSGDQQNAWLKYLSYTKQSKSIIFIDTLKLLKLNKSPSKYNF